MKSFKNYNLYVFISTFARNIIDAYSVIYLYNYQITIRNIILIYSICYFLGSIISYISIELGSKIGYKYILIFSSLITIVTFYIINNNFNKYIIAIFMSLSLFTYHPIKHYYGLMLSNKIKNIGYTLITTYIAVLLSSFLAVNNNLNCLIIIQIASIITALFIKKENIPKINYKKSITKKQYYFFAFDQFRVIFILLEPLYLYTISKNISYITSFNIILTVASILYIYFITSISNIQKLYKYINIIFVLLLLLKININNSRLLLITAFLEGIGIKNSELISTMNLYNNKQNKWYIIESEIIISIIKSLILAIIYFLNIELKIIMYILIIGIMILSFIYPEKKKNTI